MGSSEPHFHGSSRVRDHPSHTTVTLCPWFSGCDGKGVHCPGRGTHLGSTTLFCFQKSPCGASCNPSWCTGHTAWHCPMPHTFGNKPQNLPQPHGDNRLPPLCSPGCSPREQEARDTQWGAELETRAPPNPHASTPLHHYIFCWALLWKQCHQPQALLGLCPYHSVPGRDAKLSQTLSQWDDGVPDCNWERTERLAGSSSLPSSHRSHTAQPRLVTTVFI